MICEIFVNFTIYSEETVINSTLVVWAIYSPNIFVNIGIHELFMN